jgi:AcrR family transcriptional regulator
MGIAERKERQRAELREQILAAARTIVLGEGFEALTMRKIADAIEYSAATIYLYFESREAIGQQLCAESFEHLNAFLATGAGSIADPLERLTAIGSSYARFGLENPSEYRLLFMTDAAYMKAFFAGVQAEDDPGERAFQFVVDTVIACRERGAIAAAEPVLVAEMLWTSVHGIVSLAITCPEVLETPVERLVAAVCDTLAHGLLTVPTPLALQAATRTRASKSAG